jgi:hypothetical protein
MVGVTKHHEHQAGFRAAPDGGLHRLGGDPLAVSTSTVKHEDRAVVPDQGGCRAGVQKSRPYIPDVSGEHAGSMTVMAGQIGADEMSGNQAGFMVVTAAFEQNGDEQVVQVLFRDKHV